METILKILMHLEGKKRVLIVRRQNGFFGFEEEYWSDEPLELCWIRFGQIPLVICDSPETAEREASGNIGWLNSASS